MPITAQTIRTPPNIENWAKALRYHLDHAFVDYLMKGMTDRNVPVHIDDRILLGMSR